MTTMKDVAEATGLSLATVSRVFNKSDKVTDKTRRTVLKAAEKLNFRPNKMASALRSGKSKTIGVVVPIIDNDTFAAAIKSMEAFLKEAGYHIVISQSHESFAEEKYILDNLINLQVDGVILSVSKETTSIEHMENLRANGISVVLFDRGLESSEINSIIINNFQGAYQATSHLIAQGCQQIVHLAGRESVGIFRERIRGYEEAIKEHQLPINAEHIIPFDEINDTAIGQLKAVFSQADKPDGIFSFGDYTALVALGILDEMGIKVPEEVKMIGFGDSTFCAFLNPGLSSVNQRNEDVGKLAASMLLEEMTTEPGDRVYTQRVLTPEIIVRASSARV